MLVNGSCKIGFSRTCQLISVNVFPLTIHQTCLVRIDAGFAMLHSTCLYRRVDTSGCVRDGIIVQLHCSFVCSNFPLPAPNRFRDGAASQSCPVRATILFDLQAAFRIARGPRITLPPRIMPGVPADAAAPAVNSKRLFL